MPSHRLVAWHSLRSTVWNGTCTCSGGLPAQVNRLAAGSVGNGAPHGGALVMPKCKLWRGVVSPALLPCAAATLAALRVPAAQRVVASAGCSSGSVPCSTSSSSTSLVTVWRGAAFAGKAAGKSKVPTTCCLWQPCKCMGSAWTVTGSPMAAHRARIASAVAATFAFSASSFLRASGVSAAVPRPSAALSSLRMCRAISCCSFSSVASCAPQRTCAGVRVRPLAHAASPHLAHRARGAVDAAARASPAPHRTCAQPGAGRGRRLVARRRGRRLVARRRGAGAARLARGDGGHKATRSPSPAVAVTMAPATPPRRLPSPQPVRWAPQGSDPPYPWARARAATRQLTDPPSAAAATAGGGQAYSLGAR
eukprot:358368-Chlamydomonas_euryale.AAC.3